MKAISMLFLAVLVWGCGQTPPAPVQDPPQLITTRAGEKAKQPLPAPDFENLSKLALVKRSGGVRVGSNLEDALAVFAEPPGSYEKSELPPSIGEPYEARGWQRKGEGFGLILHKLRVAAAVYQQEAVNEDRLNELVRLHQENFGAPASTILGAYVRYWFWHSGTTEKLGNQILMICATQLQAGKWDVTAAIGVTPVMDALGMTPVAASRDQLKAEKAILKQRTPVKPNSANSPNRGTP